MKSIVRSLAFCLVIASFVVSMRPVQAQEANIMPRTNVDRLQERCDTVEATIRRLHTTDSLLRVNTGQVYNDISATYFEKQVEFMHFFSIGIQKKSSSKHHCLKELFDSLTTQR